jgi:hypothetical protein
VYGSRPMSGNESQTTLIPSLYLVCIRSEAQHRVETFPPIGTHKGPSYSTQSHFIIKLDIWRDALLQTDGKDHHKELLRWVSCALCWCILSPSTGRRPSHPSWPLRAAMLLRQSL